MSASVDLPIEGRTVKLLTIQSAKRTYDLFAKDALTSQGLASLDPDSQRIKLACKIKDEYAAAQHFDQAAVAARPAAQQQQQQPAGPRVESKTQLAKLIDSIPVEPRCAVANPWPVQACMSFGTLAIGHPSGRVPTVSRALLACDSFHCMINTSAYMFCASHGGLDYLRYPTPAVANNIANSCRAHCCCRQVSNAAAAGSSAAAGGGALIPFAGPAGAAGPAAAAPGGVAAPAAQKAIMAVIKEKGSSSAAVSRRLASKWPKPVWHPPWKLYRVISGHLG